MASTTMSAITTHVLDTAQGPPASGVRVKIEAQSADGVWRLLGARSTDSDGRARNLLPEGTTLAETVYRLTFDNLPYEELYPEVIIVFRVRDVSRHYHIPLLL